MKEGDEQNTTCKTKYDCYKWIIMPFGLSNNPSTFTRLINEVPKPFIRKFVVIPFDDILVYSHDEAYHVEHFS